jgi:hypothetical protein
MAHAYAPLVRRLIRLKTTTVVPCSARVPGRALNDKRRAASLHSGLPSPSSDSTETKQTDTEKRH